MPTYTNSLCVCACAGDTVDRACGTLWESLQQLQQSRCLLLVAFIPPFLSSPLYPPRSLCPSSISGSMPSPAGIDASIIRPIKPISRQLGHCFIYWNITLYSS